MPATAGRVRMPANNRVHSSAALQTHGIWQSAIGYDPYAPEKDSKAEVAERAEGEGRAENAYASFQGLLALARVTGSSANDTRGACKKCGRVGHLTYQCRNFLSGKEDKEADDIARQNAAAVFDKIKKAGGLNKGGDEETSSEEDESESSDSDVDPELERIIAARMGKNKKKNEKSDKGRKVKRSSYSSDEDDEARNRWKGKNHRRRHGSSEDNREERKKKHRKRAESSDDDSSEEDDRRRRHHTKSKKEKSHRRRPRRSRDSSEDESKDDADRRRHGKRKKGASVPEHDVSPKRAKNSDRRTKKERYRD